MAATKYSLRYLANRMYGGDNIERGQYSRMQSNLEKSGIAMRYALKTVQYYSPRYPYYKHESARYPYNTINGESLPQEREKSVKSLFDNANDEYSNGFVEDLMEESRKSFISNQDKAFNDYFNNALY